MGQLGFGWGKGRRVIIDDLQDRPGSRKARLHRAERPRVVKQPGQFDEKLFSESSDLKPDPIDRLRMAKADLH